MFGLFKKREPEQQSKNLQFQTFFATQWLHDVLTTSMAGFSGAMLCGEGTNVLTNSWKKLWSSHSPKEPQMSSEGLGVDVFRENDLIFVFITYPPPAGVGGAWFGVVVLGP